MRIDWIYLEQAVALILPRSDTNSPDMLRVPR